jgi:NADH-quinone oxidoreductase subunit M
MRRSALGVVLRFLVSTLVALAIASLAETARADDARRGGIVRLQTSKGDHGPLELVPTEKRFEGQLVIVNGGKESLVVSRIAVRGDASGPRAPPKLVARLAEGGLPITIPPGMSRTATVSWTPEQSSQRQLFGHVVVSTSDESSGEVAMGVHAQMRGPLGPLEAHLLSLLLGVPLLGALLALVLRAAGERGDRACRAVAAAALAVQTLLAIYVYCGFVSDVSRADGNDGLQLVEHVVWLRPLAAELYLGADAVVVTSTLLTSAVAFLAVLSERAAPRVSGAYHAALLVFDAAVMGALAAMDGLLFLLFASIAVASASLLVRAWGGSARRAAALRMGLSGALGIVVLAVAIVAAARHADPTFLVDGTSVTTTFSFPELSRVAFGVKGATFLGASLPKVCFVLVLLAALFFLAGFPFHGWLEVALAEAPAAAGVLVAAALPSIGLCAFLRIGCTVLSDGMRWASGVVVALGAVSAAYGALLALGQTDLRRLTACATTTHAGFVLLGAGALTPQGLSGAIVLGATRIAACGSFLLLASAIHERARTSDASRLGGVAAHMPGWATALAAAALAQAGVLGLGGAWGPVLAILGVLPSYVPLALVASAALVVLAAAHLSAVSRITFGPLDAEWTRSEVLRPFGGRFPDLTAREWTSIAPLVLLVVLLGAWPAPIVGKTTGTVRDLGNALSPPGSGQVASL